MNWFRQFKSKIHQLYIFEKLYEKMLNFKASLKTPMPESFPFLTTANPTSRNMQSWCSHSGSSSSNSWRPFSHNVNRYSTPPADRPPFSSSSHPSLQYLRYCQICIIQPSNQVLFPCLTPTTLLHQIILLHPGKLFFFPPLTPPFHSF